MAVKNRTNLEARLAALGRRLKHLRERTPYSQGDLADVVGVSRNCYINWEAGRRCPDALALADLRRALGVSAEDILQAVPDVPLGRPRTKRPAGRPRKVRPSTTASQPQTCHPPAAPLRSRRTGRAPRSASTAE